MYRPTRAKCPQRRVARVQEGFLPAFWAIVVVAIAAAAMPVTRGDIKNDVTVKGTVQADPAVTVKSIDTGQEIIDILEEAAASSNAALITITHDPHVAARADRGFRLEAGTLHEIDVHAPVEGASL